MTFDPRHIQPCGDLVPVSYIAHGTWLYRCTRKKFDGNVCGLTRQLNPRIARKYSCCEECGKAARGHGKGGKKRPSDITLTGEQKVRYLEILNGREGGESAREALEILSIEIKNGPGVCCKVCKERERVA